jgi:predicted metal-dependent HD superfamily phosphohydrolase
MSTEHAETRLRSRWHALTARLGFAQAPSVALFDALAQAYSEPGRHYHNLDHIAQLLSLLDQHGHNVPGRDAIELAIFFHDAVYVPIGSDNEAASAALARARLTALGGTETLVREVERLILATRHGSAPADSASDADLELLVDLDLSILAAERAVYAAYAAAIRHEYTVVPDLIYRPGRRRVLAEFLARPRIYATPRLYEAWEASARANLEWESASL